MDLYFSSFAFEAILDSENATRGYRVKPKIHGPLFKVCLFSPALPSAIFPLAHTSYLRVSGSGEGTFGMIALNRACGGSAAARVAFCISERLGGLAMLSSSRTLALAGPSTLTLLKLSFSRR